MSNYCSVADVQGEFATGIIFDANGKVTDTQVTAFITDASTLIDSYIGNKYALPLTNDTGGQAAALLLYYCKSLVADKCRGLLQIKMATNDVGQNVRTGLATKDILALLSDVRDGNTKLPGDPDFQLADGGFASFAAETGQKPIFHKSERQW